LLAFERKEQVAAETRNPETQQAFSKYLAMHKAAAAWTDLVYKLARSLKALRVKVDDDPKRRWQPRSPAMTAGLTDHIWTLKSYFRLSHLLTTLNGETTDNWLSCLLTA
jgi:hypothetical protein